MNPTPQTNPKESLAERIAEGMQAAQQKQHAMKEHLLTPEEVDSIVAENIRIAEHTAARMALLNHFAKSRKIARWSLSPDCTKLYEQTEAAS
jgi:hypothetical protein